MKVVKGMNVPLPVFGVRRALVVVAGTATRALQLVDVWSHLHPVVGAGHALRQTMLLQILLTVLLAGAFYLVYLAASYAVIPTRHNHVTQHTHTNTT
eukprot:m.105762 g.105762  ORF g.105762 m.105762 type:complete len:97 (+) comp13285_c0_seq5:248-538(+)